MDSPRLHDVRQVFQTVQNPAELHNIAHFQYQVEYSQVLGRLDLYLGHIYPLIRDQGRYIFHQPIPVECLDTDRNRVTGFRFTPIYLDDALAIIDP